MAHGFFLENDFKQKTEKRRPYPPLATLYAAALLREKGYGVELFDATLQHGMEQFEALLDRCRPRLVAIFEDSFNFLSKMCLIHVREANLRMIAASRAAGIGHVLVSSSDASDHPAIYLDGGASHILIGEAERTLLALVDHLSGPARAALQSIPGLAYRPSGNGSGVVRTPRVVPERDLDSLPFPAWDLTDMERYRAYWREAHGGFSLNMVTTRGCPYLCNWCAKPIWGKSYAVRSPHNVATELALLKRRYGPDHIWFTDDIFGLKPGWVEVFAGALGHYDAVVPFTAQSRADLIDSAVAAALARAGCREIWLGAESGSQRILDAMNKDIRVDHIRDATALLQRHGVRACWFIQFGYPGETFNDIKATLELIWKLLPDDVGVSVSYPLPGTAFHRRVERALKVKRHWAESNDLDMMFQGTYNTVFYRRLRDFVHRGLAVRRRLAERTRPAPQLRREREALDAEWRALERSESRFRNPYVALIPSEEPRHGGDHE